MQELLEISKVVDKRSGFSKTKEQHAEWLTSSHFINFWLLTWKERRSRSKSPPLEFNFLPDFLKYRKKYMVVFFELNVFRELRILFEGLWCRLMKSLTLEGYTKTRIARFLWQKYEQNTRFWNNFLSGLY